MSNAAPNPHFSHPAQLRNGTPVQIRSIRPDDRQRIVDAFEAEDGKIEAKCTDIATNEAMEVYIDPATGKVTDIKSED